MAFSSLYGKKVVAFGTDLTGTYAINYMTRVDFIKADIEGAKRLMLAGA